MNKVKNSQAGFTLIELVMVIVILGILAATALPKFVNLSTEAYAATAQGFAGALNSANSVNYAACAAKNASCKPVAKCSDLGTLVIPAITFNATVPVAPAVTAAGTIYLGTDTPSTATGATCSAIYGNGAAGGVPFSFTVTTAS